MPRYQVPTASWERKQRIREAAAAARAAAAAATAQRSAARTRSRSQSRSRSRSGASGSLFAPDSAVALPFVAGRSTAPSHSLPVTLQTVLAASTPVPAPEFASTSAMYSVQRRGQAPAPARPEDSGANTRPNFETGRPVFEDDGASFVNAVPMNDVIVSQHSLAHPLNNSTSRDQSYTEAQSQLQSNAAAMPESLQTLARAIAAKEAKLASRVAELRALPGARGHRGTETEADTAAWERVRAYDAHVRALRVELQLRTQEWAALQGQFTHSQSHAIMTADDYNGRDGNNGVLYEDAGSANASHSFVGTNASLYFHGHNALNSSTTDDHAMRSHARAHSHTLQRAAPLVRLESPARLRVFATPADAAAADAAAAAAELNAVHNASVAATEAARVKALRSGPAAIIFTPQNTSSAVSTTASAMASPLRATSRPASSSVAHSHLTGAVSGNGGLGVMSSPPRRALYRSQAAVDAGEKQVRSMRVISELKALTRPQ